MSPPANRGKPWSDEDNKRLRDFYNDTYEETYLWFEDAAEALKRTSYAIYCRLKHSTIMGHGVAGIMDWGTLVNQTENICYAYLNYLRITGPKEPLNYQWYEKTSIRYKQKSPKTIWDIIRRDPFGVIKNAGVAEQEHWRDIKEKHAEEQLETRHKFFTGKLSEIPNKTQLEENEMKHTAKVETRTFVGEHEARHLSVDDLVSAMQKQQELLDQLGKLQATDAIKKLKSIHTQNIKKLDELLAERLASQDI